MRVTDVQGAVIYAEDPSTGQVRALRIGDFGGGGGGFAPFRSLNGATGVGVGSVFTPDGKTHAVWSMQVVVSGFTGAVVALELSLNGSTFAEVGRFDLSTNSSGSLLTFYPHAAVSARLNVLSVSGTGTIDGWIGVV